MLESKENIIKQITKHFKGKKYNGCYVGIAKDAKNRLFQQHNVDKENGHWIHSTASSDKVAREIEDHFIEAGMKGGGGGGDEESKMVYAYKKTSSTKP